MQVGGPTVKLQAGVVKPTVLTTINRNDAVQMHLRQLS